MRQLFDRLRDEFAAVRENQGSLALFGVLASEPAERDRLPATCGQDQERRTMLVKFGVNGVNRFPLIWAKRNGRNAWWW
jgi:hypothetical protein